MVRREQHTFLMSKSSQHQISVLHVEQVSANCTDMFTVSTLPDHSAKFPWRKVCSDPHRQPSWRYTRRFWQNDDSVMLQILLPSGQSWLPCVQAIAEDVPLLEPVTVEKLDQTLRRIPDNTGLNSDCVQPGAIKHAPVDAKQEFCRILDSVIRTGVFSLGL